MGKYLFQNDTIQEALRMLDAEINPNWELPEPHPSFRKQAALGLFYRLVWFRWNDVKKRLSCF